MHRFLRFYAVTSAVVLTIVVTLTVVMYSSHERSELIKTAESSNEVLAKSLAHILRDSRQKFAEIYSPEHLVRVAIQGLPIRGAGFYNDSGMVWVMGDLSSGTDIYPILNQVLLTGKKQSQLIRSDDQGVLLSAIPLMEDIVQTPGVFALSTDVTVTVQMINAGTWRIGGYAIIAAAFLYTALLVIVWRASRLVQYQYRALVRARYKAEEGSRAKSMFLATMSHEIRTPLNGIMAAAELLGTSELGEQQRRLTDLIRLSSDGLRATIEDVLDFSRIETGRIVLEEVQFSLVRLAEDAVGMLSIRAQEKKLEMCLLVDPDTPDHMRGDAQRLSQVIVNLVGNAIKFTDSGSIFIKLRAEAQSISRADLLVEVIDTGPGVPEERRKDIFTAFEQGDNSTQRRFGGSGLGLAICKAIVERMGGQIGVTNNPKGGAKFWFTVPVDVLPERRRVPVADLSGIHVRIDLPLGLRRQVVVRYLSHAGAIMGGGDEPAHILIRNPHDDEAPSQSLNSEISEFRDVPEWGQEAVLILPPLSSVIERAWLIRAIAEAVGRVVPEREINRRSDDPPPAALGARILLVEDHSVNQTVLSMMIEQMGHAVMVASDGNQAWQLLQEHPFDAVVSDCHMPGMDGLTLVRKIREAEEGTDQHIPVVALTADARSDSVKECRDAGFDYWLAKPVTKRDLRISIDACLARVQVSFVSQQFPEGQDLPVLDVKVLLEDVLAGRPEMLPQILDDFIKVTRPDIDRLNGAIDAGDWLVARKCSHTVKGAARTAGALQLASLCQTFEDHIKQERYLDALALTDQLGEAFYRLEDQIRLLQKQSVMGEGA